MTSVVGGDIFHNNKLQMTFRSPYATFTFSKGAAVDVPRFSDAKAVEIDIDTDNSAYASHQGVSREPKSLPRDQKSDGEATVSNCTVSIRLAAG